MNENTEKKESAIVGYNGQCPLCGSADGMIQRGSDGRFRNICRVMGCKAYYRPAPFDGYDTQEDAANPFESALLKEGINVWQYLHGKDSEFPQDDQR